MNRCMVMFLRGGKFNAVEYWLNIVTKLKVDKWSLSYRGWLLHPVWYFKFRYPAANLKLSAEDLNFRARIFVSGRGFEFGLED